MSCWLAGFFTSKDDDDDDDDDEDNEVGTERNWLSLKILYEPVLLSIQSTPRSASGGEGGGGGGGGDNEAKYRMPRGDAAS